MSRTAISEDLKNRLANEVQHGATEIAVRQAEYGWSSPAGEIRSRRRIEFLVKGLPRDAAVLEVGAGTGVQTEKLLKFLDNITGIDISDDLLSHARKRAPQAQYRVMDAHALELADSSIDAVMGVSILHHLEWDKCLEECFRVLRPGGVVRFSEPNLLNPQIYLQKNIPFLKRLAGDSPDEYAFTKRQIVRALEKASFEKISVKPYEFLHPSTPRSLIPIVVKIEKLVSATPLVEIAGSLLIEAYKPR
ncbi:MAG: methyltransferase domain-containing protein [Deltaproteobacteria bacterium]|nr:methyltransferase domain-containing protein [Deltaproteobacteria bacterium]